MQVPETGNEGAPRTAGRTGTRGRPARALRRLRDRESIRAARRPVELLRCSVHCDGPAGAVGSRVPDILCKPGGVDSGVRSPSRATRVDRGGEQNFGQTRGEGYLARSDGIPGRSGRARTGVRREDDLLAPLRGQHRWALRSRACLLRVVLAAGVPPGRVCRRGVGRAVSHQNTARASRP